MSYVKKKIKVIILSAGLSPADLLALFFGECFMPFCSSSFTPCDICVSAEMRGLRLTGGMDRCSGKLEVHRNGSWWFVCNNCWNEMMASIVCSMLGCGDKVEKYTQFNPPLTHNNGTLFYYKCKSQDQSLWECKEYINHRFLCKDSKASGVICEGKGNSLVFLFVIYLLNKQHSNKTGGINECEFY